MAAIRESNMQNAELFKQHEITGIGLCVPDVIGSARNYGRLFGVGPWQLFEQRLDDGRHSRKATGRIGRLSIELREPLGDEPANRFHHISLGAIEDFDGMLESMRALPAPVDIQKDAASDSCQALFDTRDRLGAFLEIHNTGGEQAAPFAEYATEDYLVNVQDKEVIQLGIVVDDIQRFASNYTDLFGIEDWDFPEFSPTPAWHGIYRDLPMTGARFRLNAGLAMHGKMQVELLQPVSGVSTHMDFLNRYGNGIHHVSFGLIPDHDALVSKLQGGGIEIEMAGQVGAGAWFTYLRCADQLGTIYEMVGNAKSSSV